MADLLGAGLTLGGSLLGGGIGELISAGPREQQRLALERAAQLYNIPLPVLERMVAEQLGQSAMEGVSADPQLEAAQYDSLGQLQNIADNGGMTLTERADYESGQRDASQRATSQRQAILNLMGRQGGQTGGASVAMQLGAANDQAERAANVGARTSADAQRRAMQAVLERGRSAGALRGQQFGERSQRAQARDVINRYNADARRQAQGYNLGLSQQQFNNQMGLASGRANALTGQANTYGAQADRTRALGANLGTGIGQAAGALIPREAPRTSYEMDSDGLFERARLNPEDEY
jgi:hypothetical protein